MIFKFDAVVLLLRPFDQIVRPYSAGIYDATMPEIPYLEFQSFGRTLARMRKTIQEQRGELNAHRDHLETVVRQRTVELTAAKEQAEKANRAKAYTVRAVPGEIGWKETT